MPQQSLAEYCEEVARYIYESAQKEEPTDDMDDADRLFTAVWLGHVSAMQYQAWHVLGDREDELKAYVWAVMNPLETVARSMEWTTYQDELEASMGRYGEALRRPEHSSRYMSAGLAFASDYDPTNAKPSVAFHGALVLIPRWMELHNGLITNFFGAAESSPAPSSSERPLTCPKCGNHGDASETTPTGFEVRGQYEGAAVRRCQRCASGLFVKVSGGWMPWSKATISAELVPDDLWVRMQDLWQRRMA